MKFDTIKEEDVASLIKLRQELHSIPEVSENEQKTAKRIFTILEGLNHFDVRQDVGGHGIIAEIKGDQEGPTIMLRAELDALPIKEINDHLSYRSTHEGNGHMCGHDGHATMLVGVAQTLNQNPPLRGSILLVFQPAEENGVGAVSILKDEKWAGHHPDAVYALHNIPGEEMHHIIVRTGEFTAAVKSIIIQLHGKTSHAAEPEKGINPAMAISEILSRSNELSNNDMNRSDFALITPIHLEMGDIAYGISAGYGEVRLTIRTWSEDVMSELENKLLNIIKDVSEKYKIDTQLEWTQVFQANLNQDEAVEKIKKAALSQSFSIQMRNYPFKWGEDFGAFTQKYPGAMFGLGSGKETPALHNPDYDFPDEIIPTGINMFLGIIQQHQLW